MASRIPWTSWVALAAILAVGGWLRVADLGEVSLSHIESYTPGIEYPAGMSDPPTRSTFEHNWVWALNDVHGPLWYVAMLPYTRAFGTGIETMRLPAALAGVGAVVFAFLFGRRFGGEATGLTTAGMLALSGHHVFWSRQARFYGPACLIAIASCWALTRAAEGRRGSLAAFIALSLAGVATVHYYWFLLAAQLLWVAVVEAGKRPRLLGWMLLTGVAGSPCVALALFQARPFPYLDYDQFLWRFYALGFLFDPNIDAGSTLSWETGWRWVLPPVTLTLAVSAWLRGGREGRLEPPRAPGRLALGGVAAAATLVIALGYGPASAAIAAKGKLVAAAAVLPAVGLAAAWLVGRFWEDRSPSIAIPELSGTLGLAFCVATVAPALVELASLRAPFHAPRGMLLFTPALLAICAHGWVGLAASRRPLRVVVAGGVALLLVWLHLGSVRYARAERGAAHYRELAEQIAPAIEDGDLILVYTHWALTPLYYYLADRYPQFVGADWEERVAANPGARVWTLHADSGWRPEALERALGQRTPLQKFDAFGVEAELYSRR